MTSLRVRAFAAVAAVSALTGGLVVAGVASAAPGCKVDYVVQNKWQGGFTGNVTITNLGDPVDGWALRWSFPGSERFGQGWNATFSASGASVTASNVDWNRSIPTGGTASFGFNGTMTGDAVGVPATFTLNGTTCTGGTVSTTTSSTSTSTTTTTTTTGGGTPQCSTNPVNPNASVQARKLLCCPPTVSDLLPSGGEANARSTAVAIAPGAVARGGSDRSGTRAWMMAEASPTSSAARVCCSVVSCASVRAWTLATLATVANGGSAAVDTHHLLPERRPCS
ncbi:cellulose-binding domain-containing protein [Saccharothrix carnea]|nr:cellulose-binding domain-containing protein [Saccharothrix sp. CB00851]